jgi:hypothetical protein
MNKFRFTINAMAIAICVIAFASFAQAQATRTWVSGVGDDANPCSRTAPCKTFAGAISKTANFGEIDALDPAGYGAVTITKSITIDGGGGQVASVLAAGSNGINVSATSTDVITLLNLRFQGLRGAATPGISAIRINTAAAVYVIHCFIENWGTHGVDDVRNAGGKLEINNTSITNCGQTGVHIDPSSGSTALNFHITDSLISGNVSAGIIAGSNVQGVLFNSTITGSGNAGIFVQQTAGGNTNVSVDHCVVGKNGIGFQANTANSTIRVSNTTAADNATLAAVAGGGSGGTVSSYGNNQTAGNAFPSTATGQN